MKMIITVGALISLLLPGIKAHLGEMFFSCRPHAGCEIFDMCTRSAMAKLRSELDSVVENKLKESNDSWNKILEELKKEPSNDPNIKDLLAELEVETEVKIQEVHENVNKTISDLQKSIDERTRKERNEIDEEIEKKVEDTVTKMTVSVKKAQGEMDKASKQVMEELRDDTQKLVTARFEEVSRRWTVSLGQAKNNLTGTINKAMANMNRKVREVEQKIDKMWSHVNASLEGMNNEMNERLQQVVKGNFTRGDVEQLIDAKVKEANLGWGSFYGGDYGEDYLDSDYKSSDDDDDDSLGVSVTRRGLCKVSYDGKCFWIVEPELAVSFARAEYECERKGGGLGNIYSKAHLDMLNVYLRSLIFENRMYIDAWTGMTIDPRTGDVFYTNGSIANFVEWEPGSPAVGKSFTEWTNIYVIVKKEKNSIHQGIVNSSPASIRDGVLCEI